MGQFVRWQTIIAVAGAVLLAVYLNSIAVVKTTVLVPAQGGVYREGVVGAVQYLNPLLAEYNPVDADVAGLIFEGLVRDDGLGNLELALAENWSVSADGRVYVFVLRQGVKWSDGAPVTVDDVIFTLKLIQSPDFPGNPAWQAVWQGVTVERVGDYAVRFVLPEPLPSFAYFAAVGILPRHLLNRVPARDLLAHPFNLSPVGTGPFKLLEVTDRHVLLGRNPRYRGAPGQIEQLEFKMYPDPASLLAAFEAQEVDAIGGAPPDMLRRLQARRDVQIYSAPLPRYTVVYLNLQQPDSLPFFQDPAVRQGLFRLLNRQALIDEALDGQAIPATGPILPWSWAFNPAQPQPAYNPAQGIDALDSAGWVDSDGDGVRDKDGTRLAFTLLTSDNRVQQGVANTIARQWRQAGIAVTVTPAGDALFARLADHTFPAALIEVELSGDPDPYRLWHQTQIEGGQNFGGWDNAAASLALEQGRIIVEQGERIGYYYTFQQLFAEQLPALILYYPVYSYVVRDTVKNAHLSPMVAPPDRFKTVADWHLLTRRVIETTRNSNFAP